MKASDLFVRCLEAEGVQYIFGIPGEENIDLMDSLSRSSIKFILARHEQGAAFMADLYGRITGKPGVCLATLGPGATNLITGVANAHLDRSPVIAITGQGSRNRLHKESHQNVDTVALFKGITKYNQQVLTSKIIPEVIRKSFEIATLDSPGAVHIQLPEDVAQEQVEGKPLTIPARVHGQASDNIRKQAAKIIANAKNPIILAGNGVIRGRAWNELQVLVEKANLPLVNTFMAKGVLPYDHPLNLYTVGGKPYDFELRPLHAADLVIAVGLDLVEYDPEIWNEDSTRSILHIHSIPAETDVHFPVLLDVMGDLKYSLTQLSQVVTKRSEPVLHQGIRDRRKAELEGIPKQSELFPRAVMRTLSEQLGKDTCVIADVGLHKVWVSRWYQPKSPDKTMIFNGFASMGGSLAGAIGAKLAKPECDVVVVSGDGGFLMNVQELETAHRLGLAFTIVVFNDQRYSLIEKKQRDAKLAVTDISFTNPNFELLAKSFGIAYRKALTPDEFAKHINSAVTSHKLNLIEVVLGDEQ